MKKTLLATLVGVVLCGSSMNLRAQQPRQDTPTRSANTYRAAVATDWFQLASQLAQHTPGFSPPVASRAFAYMGLALYESIVPGMPQFRSLAGQLNELESLPAAQPDEPLHWPTVANAALATMTRMMFSNATPENRARIDLLERSIPLKHGEDFDPNLVSVEMGNRSQNHGKLVAMAIMTWARTDGGHEAWGPLRRGRQVYVPPSGDGKWAPTPPTFSPALLAYWGSVRPFALKSPDECPVEPPLPYSEEPTSSFYKEAAEVLRISTNATQEQRQFALYWADDPAKTPTPAGHWLFIATDVLTQRQATLEQAAQVYARLNLAMADAFIATWHAKYVYNVLRPVTYIQLAIDSAWVPTLMHTPAFPEYPSGHSVQSSAAAAILSDLIGDNTPFTDNTHNDRGWGPRNFKSFNAAAQEAALSRLYAGIHFRKGVEAGQKQGVCVAQRVLALRVKR